VFATLIINALFMTVASGFMFAFRGDTRWHRTATANEAADPAAS
jgi:hypothetical protein